jgi:hypothetical protein
MEISGISLYKLRKLLGEIVPLKPTLVDCCFNSCVAFTGQLTNNDNCPQCGESRYQLGTTPQTARKRAVYWSVVDSLKAQYKDKDRAKSLRYRRDYTSTQVYTAGSHIGDVFDGLHYKALVSRGFFMDHRDVALIASMDGYQIFRQKRDDCWVILLINANLPPETRVQRENLMISALVPGPKAPKNFNSFLRPLVDELKQLQGIISKFYVYYTSINTSLLTNSEGVPCVDGKTGASFILHAHILSWSGDIPALTKIMCTTGHHSYKACRFCFIKGIYSEGSRHIYFPLKPPAGMPGNQYNPQNLPTRTHQDYLYGAAAVEHISGTLFRREAQEQGNILHDSKQYRTFFTSNFCSRGKWQKYFT